MPGLVGEVLLLARSHVNVGTLGEGVGLELCWLSGIVVYPYIVEGVARQALYSGFQVVG
nr:hypothetical protein [Hymenobacter pini]